MKEEKTHRLEREAEGCAAGAAAGALVGAVAGPPGVIAGAILGAAAGALAGMAADRGNVEGVAQDAALDRDIGVSGGELGAPNLQHPAAILGVYSAGSAGVASGDGQHRRRGADSLPFHLSEFLVVERTTPCRSLLGSFWVSSPGSSPAPS
jgi:hypothetical protein